jgi:divalent metal cation (Fe/Co/Zn/Cd) transporter
MESILRAKLDIAVAPTLSVVQGHAVAKEVRHQLFHPVQMLGGVTVHVDPVDEAGEHDHQVLAHTHDGFPAHSH